MIRHFNYTDRKRIEVRKVVIWLRTFEDGANYFEARLNLDGLGVPLDSHVVVEAYRLTTYMRFAFGTLGHIQHAPDTRLTEFFEPSAVRFRVKVISAGARPGLLLAEAEGLRPRRPDDTDEKRRPLLPVMSEDLHGVSWRLDLSDKPMLVIDQRLGDPAAASRDPHFMALVYPAAMRLILADAIAIDTDDDEENDGWQQDWVRFARSLPGVPEPPSAEDIDAAELWVESVVQSLCRRHNLIGRLLGASEAED